MFLVVFSVTTTIITTTASIRRMDRKLICHQIKSTDVICHQALTF